MTNRPIKNKKLLWGICGVGMGHAYRQLPIIEHFAKRNQIAVFTYGNAFTTYRQKFCNRSNVKIIQATPPYLPDGERGIGFREAIDLPRNQKIKFFTESSMAFAELSNTFGRPDLVIGDYEPLCAQYSYAYNAPLITLDQQSKYLTGDFPKNIQGLNYQGEVMQLQMFYPKAEQRISCSFFNVRARESIHQVTIVPPIIRQEIRSIKKSRKSDGSIVVYLSEHKDTQDTIKQLDKVATRTGTEIKIFIKSAKTYNRQARTVTVNEPDQSMFAHALTTCSGIICTAGHGLLSESMYLGIPVYALPRMQYEALLCSQTISHNGFGMSTMQLTEASLSEFIESLPTYAANIRNDAGNVLLRRDGTADVIQIISARLK